MRIWDLPLKNLCFRHLLGEHAELHALWSVLTKNKKGYSKHPETLRWQGKLKALYKRHQAQVKEMIRRGYRHDSRLDPKLAVGEEKQNERIDSLEEQIKILKTKNCECR